MKKEETLLELVKECPVTMTETEIKNIRKQIYDDLFSSQRRNAMKMERLAFIILDAKGTLTKFRQEALAEPNNKEIPSKIEFINQEIEKMQAEMKSRGFNQQEMCEFMKPEMADKIIARMILPEKE